MKRPVVQLLLAILSALAVAPALAVFKPPAPARPVKPLARSGSAGAGATHLLNRRSLAANVTSYNLVYHGGNVMTDPLVVYMIYIGYTKDAYEPSWMNFLVDNLQGTPWWNVMTKYFRTDKKSKKKVFISGKIKLGKAIYLTVDSVVKGELKGNLGGDNSITDLIVQYLDTDAGVPYDPKALYVVVPAYNKRLKMGTYFCKKACGWHSYQDYDLVDNSTIRITYAYVPDQQQCDGCTSEMATAVTDSNGVATGSVNTMAMLDTLAHELAEAVTNPDTESGWYGKSIEEENADVCSGTYAPPGKSLPTTTIQDADGQDWTVYYNTMVGGNPVVIQQIWRPDVNPKTKKQYGCVQGL